MLRLRSDEQLVAQFRQGNDEAFSVIHDRYRQRLFAYTRQMFPGSRQDAEDAVQDVFVRAYSGLRSNDRELLALRAWLYRVAHNRCIDQLRRPPMPVPELLERVRSTVDDPIAEAEQRDSLRRLIADVRRLPEQQRSALLMRELGGMTYEELAGALGVTVPAIKSLLVRARISLVLSAQSRDTPCCEIREELALAHDQGVRSSTIARRHLRNCPSCEGFRKELRGTSRQLAALVPTLGPAALLANMLGIGGTGSGGAAATGALGGGVAATGGATFISAGHIVTLLAATAVATGGALGIQQTITGSTPSVRQPTPRAAPSITGARPASVLPAAERSWAAPRAADHHARLPVVVHSSVTTPSSPTPTVAPVVASPSPATGSHAGSAPTPAGGSTAPAASNSGSTTASQTPAPTPTSTVSTPSGASPPPSGAGAGSATGSPSDTTPPYTPPAADGSGAGRPAVPGPSGPGVGPTDPSSTPSPIDVASKMAEIPTAGPGNKTP